MKSRSFFLILISFIFFVNSALFSQLPKEQPLWPEGIPGNPVKYREEKLRTDAVRNSSPSQSNRIFSCVSTPTYIIHTPAKGKSNGVALVICPGGGFRDVWIDREGNDFALWLAERGVTSLVLKYRTFNQDEAGFTLKREEYLPQVVADARQAIFTLRSKSSELGTDKNKIGICGFSAGGSLSLRTAIGMNDRDYPSYVKFTDENSKPNFIGLFYPGLDNEMISQAGKKASFPPVFIMNGGEDTVTPAANGIELYKALTANKVSTEIHIYSKGGHGFDSGIDRGYGVSTWRDCFVDWLKDRGFISQ